MATRMKVLGIKAAVVGGRVRDLRELQATKLPVRNLSTLYSEIMTDFVCRFGLGAPRPLVLVPKRRRVCGMFLFRLEA